MKKVTFFFSLIITQLGFSQETGDGFISSNNTSLNHYVFTGTHSGQYVL